MRCLERLIDVHVIARDHAGGCRFRLPSFGFPAFPRHPVLERGEDHDAEINDPQGHEGCRSTGVAGSHDIDTCLTAKCGGLLYGCNDNFDLARCGFGEAAAAFGHKRDGGFRAQELRRCLVEVQQPLLERRTDHRAAAKTHDRHARGHPATVREPADQGRDGRDISQAEPGAAENPVPEIDKPKLVGRDTD